MRVFPLEQSSPSPGSPNGQKQMRLSAVLATLRDEVSAERARAAVNQPEAGSSGDAARVSRGQSDVSVGEIVDRTREAGFGFIIAFLAICSVPLPGISVPFGAAIMYGAVQIMIGMHRPWLPAALRRHRVSIATLDWLSGVLARWTSWIEKLVRPRFVFMTRGPLWLLCGVGLFVLGFGLSLPIPIPLSNLFFVIPIVIYAISMLERDGLLMLLAHTMTIYQIVFIVKFWDLIWQAIQITVDYFFGGS